MSKKTKLKSAINTLCTLRCENMRAIYETDSYAQTKLEAHIEKQEKLVNKLIDELTEVN